MPSGAAPGERRGGRKKGTPNKSGIKRLKKALEGGVSPLEYLLSIMRNTDPKLADSVRLDAARAAAPYVHPRLQTIQHQGNDGGALTVVIKKYGDG